MGIPLVPPAVYAVTAGMLFLTLPIYVSLLAMLIRYRKKEPFNNCFFSIVRIQAFFDLLCLLLVCCIERPAHFGFFGAEPFLLWAPFAFAKIERYLWWVAAFGQRVGTLWTAINRLTVIVYNFKWELNGYGKKFLLAQAVLPFILGCPKLLPTFEYTLISNETNSVVAIQAPMLWQDYFCFCFCSSFGIACGVCYVIIFVRVRQSRLKAAGTKKNKAELKRERAELRLAVMGAILAVLTFACGYCVGLSTTVIGYSNTTAGSVQFAIGEVLLDIYTLINPFLLLACSEKTRQHWLRFMFRKKIAVGPGNFAAGPSGRVLNPNLRESRF